MPDNYREVCQECRVTLSEKEKELTIEFGQSFCDVCDWKQSQELIFIEE